MSKIEPTTELIRDVIDKTIHQNIFKDSVLLNSDYNPDDSDQVHKASNRLFHTVSQQVSNLQRLGAALETSAANAQKNMLIAIVVTLFFLLLIIMVDPVYLNRQIIAPLRIIIRDIDRVGAGDLSVRTIVPKNEIGQIGSAFNAMAENLQRLTVMRDEYRKSREELWLVLENLPVGIYRIDVQGKLLYVNGKFAQLHGYGSADELIGKNLKEISRYTQSSISELISEVVKRGVVLGYNTEWKDAQDKSVITRESARCVRSKTGEILYIQGVMEDISEQKLLEAELIQSQKRESLGHLAGGIAHDFNNVLAAISGANQLLELQLETPELRTYTALIQKSVDRAKAITNRMLTFTRKEVMDLRPIEVEELLKGVLQIVTHTFPKSIRFEVKNECEKKYLLGDFSHIQQALMNILINASQAMPSGGEIHLFVTCDQDVLKARSQQKSLSGQFIGFMITDTGPGIDQTILNRIFEPFFTTKVNEQGSGLGLAIVKRIVEKHGGWITATSEAGAGATFTLAFQAVKGEPDLAQSDKETPPLRLSGKKILVVDDEASIANLTQIYLEASGAKVLTASSSTGAFQHIKQVKDINLLITDIGLPGLSGSDLIREALSLQPALKVIVMTGFLDVTMEAKLKNLGTSAILTKPIDFKDLAIAIQKALGERR